MNAPNADYDAQNPSVGPARHTAPLDVKDLLRRCMGKVEIAQMVLDKLEQQVSSDFDAIKAALLDGNSDATAVAAHSLKGSAGAAGAAALLTLARRLETAARAKSLGIAEEWLDEIRAELDGIHQFMPAARAELRHVRSVSQARGQ